MSKTAQRKLSAYQNGYRVGRHGWPAGVKSYTVGVTGYSAWRRGLRDGIRDQLAAQRLEKTWPRRLLSWLRGLVGRR
ncbi:hypothetical protein K32_48640 [Kaistia sp. 32K]|uniref:hypothetical protein n=1 Tax=Kaistia sp. 32K TaxID=2795690 RepID=UPI0019169ABA|nr:hypothetical protein [Kaistia sp. 32K]BCP56247.1 hypothetical protein K32_48640 [Kaistia sp. 32K]